MTRYKTPGPGDEAAARRERQAAALRENLRRRKAQARSREEGQPASGESPPEAGIPPSTARRP